MAAVTFTACGGGGGGSTPVIIPTIVPAATPAPTPPVTPLPAATATPTPVPAPPSPQLLAFWQSWTDNTTGTPYESLTSVPASITQVGIGFLAVPNNVLLGALNTYPLAPGINAIHANGGKVFISIGGACTANTINFDVKNIAGFVSELRTYLQSNPGMDGVDFDDECMPYEGGNPPLVALIIAVHQAFPTIALSMDAFVDGMTPNTPSGHGNEDNVLLQRAGWALSQVNVMAYDAYGVQPDGVCAWAATSDPCFEAVMRQFATVMPTDKLMLGLCIPICDDGVSVSTTDAVTYATWAKNNGYLGVMFWDLNRDTNGAYTNAISSALGT